jgi:hypothetical protein
MDAAILIRDLDPFQRARPVWDRAAEMILLAAATGESAPKSRMRRAKCSWLSVTRIGSKDRSADERHSASRPSGASAARSGGDMGNDPCGDCGHRRGDRLASHQTRMARTHGDAPLTGVSQDRCERADNGRLVLAARGRAVRKPIFCLAAALLPPRSCHTIMASYGTIRANLQGIPMDSTLSPNDGDVVLLAPMDSKVAEEPLSRLTQEVASRASDRRIEPSLDVTLRPIDVKNERLPIGRSSLGRRASRTVARFLIAALIGVAVTLAWQSYGEAAKQMIAGWAQQQLGWSLWLLATSSPLGPEMVAEQPSPPAVQASAPDAPQARPVAQTGPEMVAPTPAAAPSPERPTPGAAPSRELQQLDAVVRDLASLRQNIEKLAAGQEQMARNIARLEAAEQDIRHRMISAPPPQSAAAPARKPASTPPLAQPAPQVSAAPPPPAPAVTPPPATPTTSLRPPMPVR